MFIRSAVICFILIITLADGFFLPVFVRKQSPPPQTPAQNAPQWSSAPSNQVQYNSIRDYHQQPAQQQQGPPPQQQQSQYQMPALAPIQVNPLQGLHHTQFTYDASAPLPIGPPLSQMPSQFQSVQLVPCLCPITRDVIEQQAQQQAVENGNNAVLVQGSHKISS